MKYRSCVLAAVLAATLVSGSATAGTFTSGTLALSIGALPPITLPSNSATFTVTAGGGFVEPSGVFGPVTVQLPRALFTGVPQISGLTLASFGNGPVNGTLPGVVGGLKGSSLVNVLGLLNLSIPLSVVGSPGGTVMAVAGGIAITVVGQGWTEGTQAVAGITTTVGNQVLNTVTVTGSALPRSGQGTGTLVSGFKAITNVAGNLPGLASQTLRFAPEPASWLLLSAAAGSVVLFARARGRRR